VAIRIGDERWTSDIVLLRPLSRVGHPFSVSLDKAIFGSCHSVWTGDLEPTVLVARHASYSRAVVEV